MSILRRITITVIFPILLPLFTSLLLLLLQALKIPLSPTPSEVFPPA